MPGQVYQRSISMQHQKANDQLSRQIVIVLSEGESCQTLYPELTIKPGKNLVPYAKKLEAILLWTRVRQRNDKEWLAPAVEDGLWDQESQKRQVSCAQSRKRQKFKSTAREF